MLEQRDVPEGIEVQHFAAIGGAAARVADGGIVRVAVQLDCGPTAAAPVERVEVEPVDDEKNDGVLVLAHEGVHVEIGEARQIT